MRINPRQEIAMWVLGLGWGVLALYFFSLSQVVTNPGVTELSAYTGRAGILLFLLVVFGLVILSLRDRGKSN